jgi:inorganic phosphate transporter, PiT family
MEVFLILAVVFLAYSNGSNDNFKGVATLLGSGTANFKKALSFGTIATLCGSVASIFLASELVHNFSGKGLLPDSVIQDPLFAASVAGGAGITVLTATLLGGPISTTHSLVGALVGAGLAYGGTTVAISKLGWVFFYPLLVSPFVAAGATALLYRVLSTLRKRLGFSHETVLILQDPLLPSMGQKGRVAIGASSRSIKVYQGDMMGISMQSILNLAHYLSSGVVSFARGLNDTPKIVGLLLFIPFLPTTTGLWLVALAMAVGGWVQSKKVAHTLGHKITPMNTGQGFTASLITGILVTTASFHGLPVSTTHVSVGSLFGLGMSTSKVDKKTSASILATWVITLPFAALSSAVLFWVIRIGT